jgi:bacterioferritin
MIRRMNMNREGAKKFLSILLPVILILVASWGVAEEGKSADGKVLTIPGTKGREIVKMDLDKLINLLNKALADEWLAYYQYWVGTYVARGVMRLAVIEEFEEHAGDELRHAGMIAERIIQLGGTPLLSPNEWYKMTSCGYEVPENPSVVELLKQNIKGEQCAIEVYNEILQIVKDKDPVTYNMVLQILTDEVEHEEDLEAILEDIKQAKLDLEKLSH